jgi:hypothetical protein
MGDAGIFHGLFYGHSVHFIVIWYIFLIIWYISYSFGLFSCFGLLNQDKSGNPGFPIKAAALYF